MKILRILQVLLITLIITSCATTKLTEEGEVAYQEENYKASLETLEQVIESKESRGKKAKGTTYFKAGKSALELEQTDKAQKYLESAELTEYESPELYASLAKVYKIIDNLSKEINVLEDYHNKYPNGEKINEITLRLFETYVESENWDLAVDLWPEIEEKAQNDADLLAGYLIVNKNLENNSTCDKLALQIFELDDENIIALEWYAEKYFWEAENLYVTEMKAYKNNRTTRQYRIVLEALDEAYPKFRKSRNYFLKLYRIDPKPEYAKYLGNIYTRLDNKQKADYYYNKANE
ncbi:MAG: tetratricopeptide repeat protein [Thiohalospira sp.]